MGSRYIAIVGTRRPSLEASKIVLAYVQQLDRDAVIVTGCANGVDSWAMRYAQNLHLNYIVCYANWRRGKKAGPERNSSIVRIADEVMAFPDCSSKGTWDTVGKFKAAGKPWTVQCVDCDRWEMGIGVGEFK